MGIAGLHRLDSDAKTNVDALFTQFLRCEGTHIIIKPAQKQVTPIQQCGFDAQPGQNAGKLDGNVTATPDNGLAGQLRQIEHLVGTENAFLTRDIRYDRPTTGRHRNMLTGQLLLTHAHRVIIGNGGGAPNNGDTGAFQKTAVYAIETLNFCILVGNQGGPVKLNLVIRNRPAITRRVEHVFPDMRSVHEELLGNTPHIDAGAAQVT